MRKIPKAFFEPLEGVTESDLIDNEPLHKLIRKETPLAVEEAFKAKKTFATLFEINATGYFIDLPKSQWIPALEQCITFKLEEEKFEDCIAIKKLIENIKKGNKTVSKRELKKKDDGTGTK